MYEVFLNDRRIQISLSGELTFSKTRVGNSAPLGRSEVINYVKNIMMDGEMEAVIEHADPEGYFKNVFTCAFLQIKAAGGLVRRGNDFLFIHRHNRWDLPKGHVEEGEFVREAALREVAEECGLSGHVIRKELPRSYHIYISPYPESKGEWVLKETFWFEMEYTGDNMGKPQLEEGITSLAWIPASELREIYGKTFSNLKQVIRPYLD